VAAKGIMITFPDNEQSISLKLPDKFLRWRGNAARLCEKGSRARIGRSLKTSSWQIAKNHKISE
jgi:hypothetical protein